MKILKSMLFIAAIILCQQFAMGQISYGGRPVSELRTLSEDIDHIQLRAPDMEKLRVEDKAAEDKGQLRRIGESLYVDIDMENSGTWDELNDGRRVWRLKLSSKNALALGLYFDEFQLPLGSQLFVYSPDRVQTLGSYNEKNNADGGSFAIELVYGESLIIEYVSPKQRAVEGMSRSFENTAKFHINRVSYAYRDVVDFYRNVRVGESGSCQVNVNCSEGDNWQNQKKGVARILIDAGNYQAWCSGSLVNNTNEDGTPYFLSAWHCREGVSEAYLNNWIFYFNYEITTCNGSSVVSSTNTITGASTKAEGSLNGGSDFLLMELNSTPPASYNAVFNGWKRSSSSSPSGVSIHHPAGDVKKISTYTSSLSTSTYNGGSGATGASGAHWLVYWSATNNGHGVTEGGSSGSPIFNNNGLIVGTLSGGSSYCDATNQPDLYGKFSYHWTSNGSAMNKQLKPWLDPANTGVSELGFYDPNNAGLHASFNASTTNVTEGGTVTFTSTSTGGATSYSWSFPGGTPSASTLQNPTVTYNTAGTYDVTLTVSGGGETDTHTANNYITVTAGGTGDNCVSLNYPLEGTATGYTVANNGGYVTGTNTYGDLSKVNFYNHTGVGYVTKLGFNALAAEGSSSNIKLVVYSDNGGTPGNLLGSKTISMSSIVNAFTQEGEFYEFMFDAPIQVSGNFFAGIELPTQGTFALVSNTDGDTNPGIAWEQWSDGSWNALSSSQSFGLNIALAVFPEVCATLSGINIRTLEGVSVYPNPTTSLIIIETAETMQKANVKIYNSVGGLVYELNKENCNTVELDMSAYSDGLYILYLENEKGTYREKIQLMK